MTPARAKRKVKSIIKNSNNSLMVRQTTAFRKASSELALPHTAEAMATLVEIMRTGECREKLKAAEMILDRAYGKPAQAVAINESSEIDKLSLDEIRAQARQYMLQQDKAILARDLH